MTQTAQAVLGLLAKLYIATTQGTAITVSAGVVTGGTVISGLTKITPPKPKWATEDITTLNNADSYRRFLKTLIEGGEIQIEGNWESADPGQIALAAAFNSAPIATYGQNFGFLLMLQTDVVGGQTVSGDQWSYPSCLVTDFVLGEAEVDKRVPFSATLKINAAPVFTAGS
jgi:hypothetical protein